MKTNFSLPEVIINVACSLDGIIGSHSGPLELSNQEDWLRVHKLRDSSDAVLVGINTILNDNPSLKVKKVSFTSPHPYRVVLDTHLKVPLSAKIVQEQETFPTILFTASTVNALKLKKLRERGVYVEEVDLDENGFLSLPRVLCVLSQNYGVKKLMVEGGGKTIVNFVSQELVDKLIIFYAPVLIGSINGVSFFPSETKKSISEQDRIRNLEFEKLGDGILVSIDFGEKK